jgi:chemotaxis signal transduction protein
LIPLSGVEAGGRPWVVGIPAAAVVELVEPEQLVPVPGTASWAAGIMPWRNRVIGVLDLEQRLELKSTRSRSRLVMVTSLPGATEPMGLLIPRGVRMLKLPVPNITSERSFPGNAEALLAAIEIHDQTIALLDLNSLASPR